MVALPMVTLWITIKIRCEASWQGGDVSEARVPWVSQFWDNQISTVRIDVCSHGTDFDAIRFRNLNDNIKPFRPYEEHPKPLLIGNDFVFRFAWTYRDRPKAASVHFVSLRCFQFVSDAIAARFGTPLAHEYNLLNLLARRPEIGYATLVELTDAGCG